MSHQPTSAFRFVVFFFFNDTATTEIYTLSLHDALPIYRDFKSDAKGLAASWPATGNRDRSEEHTSELQSRVDISYAVFCLKYNTQQPPLPSDPPPSRWRPPPPKPAGW